MIRLACKQYVSERGELDTMRIWLRDLRVSKGYTQEVMGKKLGVTRQQYSFIENMDRQEDLKLSTATKIADIFKISLKRIRDYEEALKEKTNEAHSSV